MRGSKTPCGRRLKLRRVARQTFTPKATKGSKLDGSLAAEYVIGGGMKTEVTLLTSGVIKGMFEAANVLAKGLTVKAECETPAPSKGGILSSAVCDADYKTGPFNCKGTYNLYKGDLSGEGLRRRYAAPPPRRRPSESARAVRA